MESAPNHYRPKEREKMPKEKDKFESEEAASRYNHREFFCTNPEKTVKGLLRHERDLSRNDIESLVADAVYTLTNHWTPYTEDKKAELLKSLFKFNATVAENALEEGLSDLLEEDNTSSSWAKKRPPHMEWFSDFDPKGKILENAKKRALSHLYASANIDYEFRRLKTLIKYLGWEDKESEIIDEGEKMIAKSFGDYERIYEATGRGQIAKEVAISRQELPDYLKEKRKKWEASKPYEDDELPVYLK